VLFLHRLEVLVDLSLVLDRLHLLPILLLLAEVVVVKVSLLAAVVLADMLKELYLRHLRCP